MVHVATTRRVLRQINLEGSDVIGYARPETKVMVPSAVALATPVLLQHMRYSRVQISKPPRSHHNH